MHPLLRQVASGAVAVAAAGCGAGPTTVHPAHAIREGKVVLGLGVSGNFATGDVKEKIDRGHSLTPQTAVDDPEQTFVDGAIAQAMIGPGVAPWAGGRVGLGYDSEAELTYAGRSFRVGGRHAFEDGHWAVSVGGGASVVLLRPGSDPPNETATGVGRFQDSTDETSVTGWGLDVPVVAGYRSEGEVVQVWVGARGGVESVAGDLPLVAAETTSGEVLEERANLEARRWYAGGLVGLAVGLDPVWVGMQLDAAYQSVTGHVGTNDATDPLDLNVEADGLTLSPAGVLWGKF